MTEAQVLRALGKIAVEKYDPEDGCYELVPALKGLSFMMLDSRLARIDVTEGSRLTAANAGIGMPEAEIRRIYPRVRVEPHHYLEPGQGYHFVVVPSDPKLKRYDLLFETFEGKVTSLRPGLSDAVALAEGCA